MDSAASASSKLFGRHHLAHHALPLSAHPVEVVDIIAVCRPILDQGIVCEEIRNAREVLVFCAVCDEGLEQQ